MGYLEAKLILGYYILLTSATRGIIAKIAQIMRHRWSLPAVDKALNTAIRSYIYKYILNNRDTRKSALHIHNGRI